MTEPLVCIGCKKTFKHLSSLSLHKNGSVKKGLKPCKMYHDSVGKEYKDKIESRTITEKEYTFLMKTWGHVMEWIKKEEEIVHTQPPPVQLQPFGKAYPPPHVSLQWMKERFMKQRYGDFVTAMFAGFHLNTDGAGRGYCTVRIPKASHSNDAEIFDGTYWIPTKLSKVIYEFINRGLIPVMEEIEVQDEEEEDYEFTDKLGRFINRWSPDDPEEVKQGFKEDIDDDNRSRIYKYEEMINNIKAALLGSKREDLNSIKKEWLKYMKN
jgi:hypothetical protein